MLAGLIHLLVMEYFMTLLRQTLLASVMISCGLLSQAALASAEHMVVAVQQLPPTVEPQGINNNAIDRVVSSIYETLICLLYTSPSPRDA